MVMVMVKEGQPSICLLQCKVDLFLWELSGFLLEDCLARIWYAVLVLYKDVLIESINLIVINYYTFI